jgi:hypothetical protein
MIKIQSGSEGLDVREAVLSDYALSVNSTNGNHSKTSVLFRAEDKHELDSALLVCAQRKTIIRVEHYIPKAPSFASSCTLLGQWV